MTNAEPSNRSTSGEADGQRGRWSAFAVAVAVAALTILDVSKVNVGLPSIETSLHASSSQLQLIVAGYALAFGLALVPSGRLGDIRSRKTMFIIGLSGFVLASVACAVAPTILTLTIARLVQGFAAGVQIPQVLGLVQQLFRGAERGRAFGIFGATVGVSTALGPTLGGVLIALGGEQNGWRLLFWVNVPLGAIALVLAVLLLRGRQQQPQKDTQLDLVGVALLGVAVLGLMLPFVLTTGQGDSPARFGFLVLFAVALAAFLRWERRYRRRGRTPAVRLDLFSLASYRNGLIIQGVFFSALPALFLTSTLYLQEGLRLSPLGAGLTTASYAGSSALMSLIGGRLVNRYGRLLVVIGLAVGVVGVGLVTLAATVPSADSAPYWMAAAYLFAGAGGGIVVSPNQTLTLSQVPVEVAGVGGSMNQLAQRIGTAIGPAAVTAVFFGTVTSRLGAGALGGSSGTSGGAPASGADLLAFHDAYRLAVLVVAALLVVALAVAITDQVQRVRRDRSPEPQEQDAPAGP